MVRLLIADGSAWNPESGRAGTVDFLCFSGNPKCAMVLVHTANRRHLMDNPILLESRRIADNTAIRLGFWSTAAS